MTLDYVSFSVLYLIECSPYRREQTDKTIQILQHLAELLLFSTCDVPLKLTFFTLK